MGNHNAPDPLNGEPPDRPTLADIARTLRALWGELGQIDMRLNRIEHRCNCRYQPPPPAPPRRWPPWLRRNQTRRNPRRGEAPGVPDGHP